MTTNQRSSRYSSISDAAEYLGCNERTIRRYIAEGKFPGYRMGRLLRVNLNEVDAAFTVIRAGGAS